jgi:membrane-bound lytic murein transglycosylase D
MGCYSIKEKYCASYGDKKKSFLLRRIGGVSIYANDHLLVPFSYWMPTKSQVIIPTSLVHQSELFRMAVCHELQHHRQSDTKWIYILLGLRLICCLNPLVFLWNRWILEIGEFACDEALIQQKKVNSLQYARCLGEVAERVRTIKNFRATTNGLAFFLAEKALLKKRIENIFSNTKRVNKSTSWVLAGALLSLITLCSFFFQRTVQDRRVFKTDAMEMVRSAKLTSEFPFESNDLVLTQLNRFIGTPEGRDFMKSSLKRMEEFRVMIEGKIREYQLPMELLAIPIVESGYRNQPEREDPRFGAGIWMFVKPTAITYGLKVDRHVDERLDPLQLTDAAMRYLKGSEARFKDWLLAIQSFNSGVRRVEEGIEETGSRDAWVISKLGYDNDKNYLAKVMAAILILKNPKSVQ